MIVFDTEFFEKPEYFLGLRVLQKGLVIHFPRKLERSTNVEVVQCWDSGFLNRLLLVAGLGRDGCCSRHVSAVVLLRRIRGKYSSSISEGSHLVLAVE